MAEFTLLHNPRCSTSRAALDAAEGADVEVVRYLDTPLSYADLLALIGKLEDAPGDLVRRDARFKELGLSDTDVETPEQVATVLAEHPALMQRPVLVRGDRAIIGRPKDRVPAFLRGE
ncbi:arsenate reductase [Calidifontibacter sp. DB0510]|uniref:Arsenate reductase n=1 Tax=Metallococcus carri TaxID=1656884 RepID=A0A967E987_9MICO|nr:ArsC/Spx/MgsR family protein [Metallococcus carri]NHN56102.1 arsenate reductase [Metallococcus carri]NOP37441.1 arsenate reductase [Calidifontibacter sp. DB2511S]